MQEAEYQGEVKNPAYCSWYERLTGFTKDYDPNWLANHRDVLMKYDAGRSFYIAWVNPELSVESWFQSIS